MAKPRQAPTLLIAVTLLLLLPWAVWPAAPPSVRKDPGSAQSPPTAGAPVVFAGESLFSLYAKLGSFTPQERAKAVVGRLERLSKDPLGARSITVVEGEAGMELVAGDMVLVTVTSGDAEALGRPRGDLAKEYARTIERAVESYRQATSLKQVLIGAVFVVLATVGLILIFKLVLNKVFPRLYDRIRSWKGTHIRPLKVQRLELLSADQIADLIIGLARAMRLLAIILILYLYLSLDFSFFPWTRGYAIALFDYTVAAIRVMGTAVLASLPNLLVLAVIVVTTRYLLKLIRFLFLALERGVIKLEGFHRDWARPTYQIVRLLSIVLAAMVAFPYIPGSGSTAFQAISVFLGVLVSLGSTSAVANVVAGMILTYMRPFRVGDRVQIADTVGDILEKTLLVTRVRTIKNVAITIPNSIVLGSHIVNYSSSAQEGGLILHTSVTIGYDAPWRRVHELLIAAARATKHILKEPGPFVLETSLDDFYVTYELNAYTDEPNLMASIYGELHQNIQDQFNEAGLEIMSPHYTQLRDGNQIAIPAKYLPKGYAAPAIRVTRADAPGGAKTEGPSAPGGDA